MYTVTFCGHRQVAEQSAVRAWLDALLPELYAQGARRFYLGGYGDFDSLAVVRGKTYRIDGTLMEYTETKQVPSFFALHETVLRSGVPRG